MTTRFYQFAHWLLSWLIRLCFTVKVRGQHYIPDGPFILASNHLHQLDPIFIMLAFPARRYIHWLAAKEFTTDVPFLGWIIRLAGNVIPVDRSLFGKNTPAIQSALQLLCQGEIVGIFPEGRIGNRENSLLPFRRGIGYLSVQSQLPIVPVVITGTHSLRLRKSISIEFGPPLRGPINDVTIITDLLRTRMVVMMLD